MRIDAKILDVRARAIILRPSQPTMTSAGALATTPLILIDLHTDEGVTGVSYLRCYSHLALAPLRKLIVSLGGHLAGDFIDTEQVLAKLRHECFLMGWQGLIGMAIAGLDMALWDVIGKALNMPLVSLLGGKRRDLRAYASLRSMEPRAAAEQALEAAGLGFPAVKLKVGGGELAHDIAAIRTIRDAIGTSVELMVDYNQRLNREDAATRLEALDDEGLTWIEEPIRADDYEGYRALFKRIKTPLQIGENCWGAQDVQHVARAGASRVMFDAMKVGGVSGWLEALEEIAPSHLRLSSHTFPEVSAHLLSVSPEPEWLEFVDHAGPILRHPLPASIGIVRPAELPGNGIAWDEPAVRRVLA